MAHQPDVQKQQQQEQHQRLQDQPNIVYIQQNPQNFRNHNYQYPFEGQNNLIENQPFQQQNANFRQFENHYPFVGNGHFSPPNSSATIISNCFDPNKSKNDAASFRNTQFLSNTNQDLTNCHQRNESAAQCNNGTYQSVGLQNLNYQQSSQFFLPNIGNQYQLNDILVPTYQSSGSSESSDESSVSNTSHQHFTGDSNSAPSNQFEFSVPIHTTNQVGQNFQQFQQKDFLDNYMALLPQENQIPRCDSSKSETAESTCSSLSSGSTESQSENENVVRLPVLVNPVVNNGSCNLLQPYQANTHNSVTSFSNQMHHSQMNDLINRRNYSNQTEENVSKCNGNYINSIIPNSITNGNISGINSLIPPTNQMNNVVVMLPNQLNKNIQNCVTTNESILPNPPSPSPDTVNPSRFVIQNQKINQHKIFGLINVNQLPQEKMDSSVQLKQPVKVSSSNIQSNFNGNNNHISSRSNGNGEGNFNSEENSGCNTLYSISNQESNNSGDDVENSTSQVQNTSDSSVINSNYFQNNFLIKPVENQSNSAILFKETSDKSISQCISNVNNSVVDSKNVYLVTTKENDVIKNICYEDSSATSTINVLPVPVGWRRLLVDGSIIYVSPSNIALSSMEQVKMYLQTIGTCKCGLECPVNCDSVFNFNPKVISRPWNTSDSELTRLCNHKRKAPVPELSVTETEKIAKLNRKEAIPTKRKKKKHGNGNSAVSVSQLLAQRDRALAAAAAARWSANTRPGNVGYQNIPTNQYQSVEIVRNQILDSQTTSYENKPAESFKQDTLPGRVLPADKTVQLPYISVVNNSEKDGSVLNMNGVNQLVSENHSGTQELINPQININPLVNQRQETTQGMIGHPVNCNQSNQEFIQGSTIPSRQEGVVLTPQGMLFPPNMIMQRPRSIPPWHQSRLGLNKKPVPETPIVYERVPYIQHMPPPSLVFEESSSRRKQKTCQKAKKVSQETTQNQPSFMENPSAYLAQQTALLQNTISRPNFNISSDPRSVTVLPQNFQNFSNTTEGESGNTVLNNSNIVLPSSTKHNANSFAMRTPAGQQKINQSNLNQAQICQKNVLEKVNIDSTETSPETNLNFSQNFEDSNFNNHVCSNTNCIECKKPCLFENRHAKGNQSDRKIDEQIRLIQENLEKSNPDLFNQQTFDKSDWRVPTSANEATIKSSKSKTEDQNNSFEDNPVTSSTEKAPLVYNQKVVSDSRPIQGGTISTSNGSPQPQASPSSSIVFRQEVSSPKHSELTSSTQIAGNVFVSSSTNSSFVVSNSVCSSMVRDENCPVQYKLETSGKKEGSIISQPLTSVTKKQPRLVSPDNSQQFKLDNSNFMNVTTTSDQKFNLSSDAAEDHAKVQSVTSTLDISKEESRKDKNNEMKGNRSVRTMASGHTVSSNTIISVQAGKAQTSTVTVNNNSPTTPTTISLVNLAGQNSLTTPALQKGHTKSPLEMVQSVVSSIQTSPVVKNDVQPNILSVNKTVLPTSNVLNNILTTTANLSTSILTNNTTNATPILKTSPGGFQAGHILVSSNGQYIVASNGNVIPQTNLSGLKLNQANTMPSMSASPVVTSVAGAVTQVLPAVGVAQQVLGQPTVLVNALPAPFVIQPGVMAVDTGLGRLAVATGGMLQSSLIDNNTLRNSIRGLTSPEKVKKKGNKKRKNQVASLVQMASPNNVILNQPFNQQNFAVSPGGSVQPLQALTLLQGKHGAPTQIVMNNQNNFNHFNTQPQQINLLQPVNLASVPNFPAFQQFIVPGLGNMVMSTDGTTTILPDTNIGVQLQLQNVNGQSLLTPVQNTSFINGQGILTTPAGMLIRAPNNQQKIIQNNSSPQFLSPNNSQFLVNQFQGQLSPLITTNLSPNQQIFTSSPPRQSPQEFIQIIPTSSSQNTTVVQQNTTIVQQQTTMVSNNQNILNNSGKSNFILNNPSVEKPIELQIIGASQRQAQPAQSQLQLAQRCIPQEKVDIGTQHSVSTQTVINKEASTVGVTTNNTFCQTLNSNWSGSPPDTTTHSPVESESNADRAHSPATEGNSEDCLPQAMVQYVSSSINENESEGEAYLLPGIPKILTTTDGMGLSSDKTKNIVESSTILQEAGVQIQIGRGYVSSRLQKATVDECVVSSHSDVNIQEKHIESLSNISSYQEDKAKLMDALLSEGRPDDIDQEAENNDLTEKLSEGDLVWGPVRGSPAWPGKLVGPISPGGKALVRWFGGHSSPTRVNVSQLQSLSQGLEAHHRASNKGRKNRRLNIELEAAIQEAMLELDKMTAQQKKISSGRSRRSHR